MVLLGSVTVDWAMFFVFMKGVALRLSNPSQGIKESFAPQRGTVKLFDALPFIGGKNLFQKMVGVDGWKSPLYVCVPGVVTFFPIGWLLQMPDSPHCILCAKYG